MDAMNSIRSIVVTGLENTVIQYVPHPGVQALIIGSNVVEIPFTDGERLKIVRYAYKVGV